MESDEKVARDPKSFKVTDFVVYNIRDEIYLSDSLGRIVAVKIGNGEVTETHCFYQIDIQNIWFSPNQSYLSLFYASGCCQIVSSQSFMVELNLVDHQYDPNVTSKPKGLVKIKEDLRRMKDVGQVYHRIMISRRKHKDPSREAQTNCQKKTSTWHLWCWWLPISIQRSYST